MTNYGLGSIGTNEFVLDGDIYLNAGRAVTVDSNFDVERFTASAGAGGLVVNGDIDASNEFDVNVIGGGVTINELVGGSAAENTISVTGTNSFIVTADGAIDITRNIDSDERIFVASSNGDVTFNDLDMTSATLMAGDEIDITADTGNTVSYTHLTLPTKA